MPAAAAAAAAAASQLTRAIDATGQVISAISDGQWAGPTPCSEWTVSDLVRQRLVACLGRDVMGHANAARPAR